MAGQRLKLERLPAAQAERVRLIDGSLMDRDRRQAGFDGAAVVEVVDLSTRRGCRRASGSCSSSPGRERSS